MNQKRHPIVAPCPSGNTETHPPEMLVTLQALRGVATLLVVYFHAILWQAIAAPGYALQTRHTGVKGFGAAGVDLFFVLSGFIMATVAPRYQTPRGAARFFIKRLIRVVPLYWVSSALCIALIAGRHVHAGKAFSSFFFWPVFERGRPLFPYNPSGWSLSFEMYFYFAVALGILLCRPASVIRCVAMAFAGLVAVGIMLPRMLNIQMFLLNPIVLEFVFGCCIGLLYQHRCRDTLQRYWLLLIGIGVVGFLATILFGFGLLTSAKYTFNGQLSLQRVVLWGMPSAFLVAGLVFGNHRLKTYVPCWLTLIGNASYSIYLTQGITFTLLKSLYRHHQLAGPDTSILIGVNAVVLVGLGQYWLVERRLIASLNRRASAVLPEKAAACDDVPTPAEPRPEQTALTSDAFATNRYYWTERNRPAASSPRQEASVAPGAG